MTTPNPERQRLENTFPLNTFKPETKRQLVEFVLQEIEAAQIDEIDQLWLSHGDHVCRNCTFEQIMTCNNDEDPGKDITVIERRKQLRHQTNKPSEDKE